MALEREERSYASMAFDMHGDRRERHTETKDTKKHTQVTALSQVVAFEVDASGSDAAPPRRRRSASTTSAASSTGIPPSNSQTSLASSASSTPGKKPLADGGRASPRTIAARNAATQSTPQDDKENPVRVVEKRLEAERRLTEALRREVALLKEQERDARRDADAWRKEAEKLRDEAARHAASAADASQGLEREAEMAWREAETWVEREEALERREAYAHESALGDAEQVAAPSPRSWPSSASSSKGRRRTHFAPASPQRGRDDDDDDESWAVALHRNAGKAEEPPKRKKPMSLHEKLSSPRVLRRPCRQQSRRWRGGGRTKSSIASMALRETGGVGERANALEKATRRKWTRTWRETQRSCASETHRQDTKKTTQAPPAAVARGTEAQAGGTPRERAPKPRPFGKRAGRAVTGGGGSRAGRAGHEKPVKV